MQKHYLARLEFTLATLVGLVLISTQLSADPETQTKKLNLYLPAVYTDIPATGIKANLNIAQYSRHAGAFKGIKTKKMHPYGYKQHKVDKSMRVRGWEVMDKLYMGQTRVGDDWGFGMMMTNGNFAYGINDDSIGMVYTRENAVYRINMEEISLEIDF